MKHEQRHLEQIEELKSAPACEEPLPKAVLFGFIFILKLY